MLALRMAVTGTLYLGTTLGLLPWLLLRTEAARGEFGPWKWLALPPFLLGAYLTLRCGRDFARIGEGTPAPFDPPKKFVPRGPYRLVRNPMYVGGILLLLGFGLYLASAAITLLGLAAFLLVHIFVVAAEEPGLRKRFGREYEEYCQAVPRWIPRLTRMP